MTVEEIQKEKEKLQNRLNSILFFESKSDILTMKIHDYLKQVKCSVSMIPYAYIKTLNSIESNRELYVFDFIGIGVTNVCFPKDMNPEVYRKFILKIDSALQKNGLSCRMAMDDEQRKIFDFIVIEREKQNKNIPRFLLGEEWYRLIRDRIYRGLPPQIGVYLNIKNRQILLNLASYVSNKCSNVKLSEEVIIQFLNEALNINNVTLEDLRTFDESEYRQYVARKSRKK